MLELELTRVPGDRRLYSLDGVGTLRLQGVFSRSALAEADGTSWRLATTGFWKKRVTAADAGGALVGEFEPRGGMRRGGIVRWAGREYALRPASRWRERYALADGDRELAVVEGKGWGKRPVVVGLEDAVEPGLVLFVAFVVRGLAEDTAATTAAVTS